MSRATLRFHNSSPKNSNVHLNNAMLKNVVGLVTGGASGLGRATAARFIREGAKVTICDLPTSQGEEVAKELSSGMANTYYSSVTNES